MHAWFSVCDVPLLRHDIKASARKAADVKTLFSYAKVPLPVLSSSQVFCKSTRNYGAFWCYAYSCQSIDSVITLLQQF